MDVVEQASKAIQEVFGDTGVDQLTTIDRLTDLKRECQECINLVQEDLDKEDA